MPNYGWGSSGARLALTVGLLVGAFALAACDGAETAAPNETSPAVELTEPDPTRAAPTASATDDEDVSEPIAAYLAFWDAVEAAADPPDPDHPALAETAADPQLSQLREVLTEYRNEGYVRRGDNRHHPELREMVNGGTAAIVDDCSELDSEAGLYDAETGELIDGGGEPGDRELLEARLELINGTWKVVNVNVVEEDSACVP